jgi:hypothetical protein
MARIHISANSFTIHFDKKEEAVKLARKLLSAFEQNEFPGTSMQGTSKTYWVATRTRRTK